MGSVDAAVGRVERYREVVEAVRLAVSGTELGVREVPDIEAVEVVGAARDAYVMVVGDGGYQVDLWRHEGRNPYRIVTTAELDEAVAIAVSAVAGRRRRVARRETGHPPREGVKAGTGR